MSICKAEAFLVIFFVLLYSGQQMDSVWDVSGSRPDEFQFYYSAALLLAGLAGVLLGRAGFGNLLWKRLHHADTLAFGSIILIAGLVIALFPMVTCLLHFCYDLLGLSGGRFGFALLLLFVGMYFVGAGAFVWEESREPKRLPKRTQWRLKRAHAVLLSPLLLLAILPLVHLSAPPTYSTPPCGSAGPYIQLLPAQDLGSGQWSIEVDGVSYSALLSCFRIVVWENGTTVAEMDPLFAGSEVGIVFTDSRQFDRLDVGDRFTVTCTSGSEYTLHVIWKNSLNQQGKVDWST